VFILFVCLFIFSLQMKMSKQDAEEMFIKGDYGKGLDGKTWAKTFTAVLQGVFKASRAPAEYMDSLLQNRRYKSNNKKKKFLYVC